MVDRIIHSGGIVVCELRYLTAMRELQAEADAGRPAYRHAGDCVSILPMSPEGQKLAKVKYCESCELIVVAKSDQIPPNEVPEIAK
jgi:hypothetical protein